MSTSDVAPGSPDPALDWAQSPAAETDRATTLSESLLAQHLDDSDVDLEVVVSTPSTNTDLVLRTRERAPQRIVLRAASHQSAGRGRLGRLWQGSFAGSLLFSLALPWRGDPAESATVTLACGLAVVECLRAHDVPAQLKWPNDVLLGGRKLAGILTETAEDPCGHRTLVIGMGLNLALEPAQRLAIGQPAAELAEIFGRTAVCAQRELWLARCARAMIDGALQFERVGFASLRERFNACFAFLGKPVRLHAAGRATLSGIARGVDECGRLLIDSEGEPQAVISGEMSLRAEPPEEAAAGR